MQRVLIVGCSGAGKSTFARRLGAISGLPVTHLDRLFWQPGWVPPNAETWRDTVSRVAAGQLWIVDGNYRAALEIALPIADTVIWLDVARHVCLSRVTRRAIRFEGTVRPDMAEGCPERLDDELLRYIADFEDVGRPNLIRRLATYGPHLAPVVLRCNRDMAQFIGRLPRPSSPSLP